MVWTPRHMGEDLAFCNDIGVNIPQRLNPYLHVGNMMTKYKNVNKVVLTIFFSILSYFNTYYV